MHPVLEPIGHRLYNSVAIVQIVEISHTDGAEELSVDVLTDVLRHLQVSGRAALELELGAPWSITVPDMDRAVVHIVGLVTVDHVDAAFELGHRVCGPESASILR